LPIDENGKLDLALLRKFLDNVKAPGAKKTSNPDDLFGV
jgi:hypothetical protein